MGWVAETRLLSNRKLLLLDRLGARRRRRPVVLPQLGRAGEGIWCYWCRGASIACASCLPTVVSLHMLALLVGLQRRILVGVGRIGHCDGGGRLRDWRKYLSHRDLTAVQLTRLDRGRLEAAVDREDGSSRRG